MGRLRERRGICLAVSQFLGLFFSGLTLNVRADLLPNRRSAQGTQELLGHAYISLTLNVYSHVLPYMGDAAAGAMDN